MHQLLQPYNSWWLENLALVTLFLLLHLFASIDEQLHSKILRHTCLRNCLRALDGALKYALEASSTSATRPAEQINLRNSSSRKFKQFFLRLVDRQNRTTCARRFQILNDRSHRCLEQNWSEWMLSRAQLFGDRSLLLGLKCWCLEQFQLKAQIALTLPLQIEWNFAHEGGEPPVPSSTQYRTKL